MGAAARSAEPVMAAKKVVKKTGKSPKGKGGIFPWVTNTPGSTLAPGTRGGERDSASAVGALAR